MPLVIDLVMLALLVGTVGYVWVVERRVRALMALLRELEPVVDEFSAAVDKSASSVGLLKSLAQALPGASRREPPAEPSGFRADRPQRPAHPGRVAGKSDLVRGFFEAARSRGA